jgi:uncharacterized protein YyaL (SSP411 family)
MSSSAKANRLIHSTSPYLLQHAYNPVAWFEWGVEALDKAVKEDKPILVSIGYSSCHWCHVMEHESFEKTDVAKIMNDHFVCIKVDREERPDIDHVYMEAVQAMGVNGGWPLNVFLTPDQKPFYGGTYFPQKNWMQLLLQISQTFLQKRADINQSAEDLSNHLQTSDLQRFAKDPSTAKFTLESLDKMVGILAARFDTTWGGMEKAPKFVMPTIWQLLLRYHTLNENQEALRMVNLTLTQMAYGGIYDQVGGGFSRYSVDGQWFAPHFEKMLYDNAQLISLYAEAYSVSKNELFRDIVYETTAWLQREMMSDDGGFYSALDADSEGIEGKFYTWTLEEIKENFPEDWEAIATHYQVTQEGNWEHGVNILWRKENDNAHHIELKKKILERRALRIRPGLDDKILTCWNAMMIKGLTDAYKAFGDDQFLVLALKNIAFLETHLIENGIVYRSFKNKHSHTEGFLEDYAFLIQAYIALYQVTFQEVWLRKANTWCNFIVANFHDRKDGYFHFSSKTAEKLIAKKKEIFDNVIPSSNSVMARNLYHLGILGDHQEWKEISTTMIATLASVAESEPGYMSHWAILFAEITKGMAEVVVVGKDAEEIRKEFHAHYFPFALTLGTTTKSNLPLFEGRDAKAGETKIYVCFNKTCGLPVEHIEAALHQLHSMRGS